MIVASGAAIVSNGLNVNGGVAIIGGAVSAGQAVTFTGSGGDLVIDNLAAFSAVISGLSTSGQKIDLGGYTFSAGETVTWTEAAGNTSGTLTVSGAGIDREPGPDRRLRHQRLRPLRRRHRRDLRHRPGGRRRGRHRGRPFDSGVEPGADRRRPGRQLRPGHGRVQRAPRPSRLDGVRAQLRLRPAGQRALRWRRRLREGVNAVGQTDAPASGPHSCRDGGLGQARIR